MSSFFWGGGSAPFAPPPKEIGLYADNMRCIKCIAVCYDNDMQPTYELCIYFLYIFVFSILFVESDFLFVTLICSDK